VTSDVGNIEFLKKRFVDLHRGKFCYKYDKKVGYKVYFSPTHSQQCGDREEKNKGQKMKLDIID
jgi:hypothetical protein